MGAAGTTGAAQLVLTLRSRLSTTGGGGASVKSLGRRVWSVSFSLSLLQCTVESKPVLP